MFIDIVTTRAGRPAVNSLYEREHPEPRAPRLALSGTVRTDVAIIGAGFTGLSAALHLRRAGVDCVVLDANEPGWGASGRNGGQLNPGLKYGPRDVAARFGEATMRRTQEVVDVVAGIISEENIRCDIRRGGTLRAATDQASKAGLAALAEEARSCGVDYRLLGAEEVAAMTGSRRYKGGLIDPAGGQLNPLKYVLGLADAVSRRGGRIFCDSAVTGLSRNDQGWHLRTAGGEVLADKVLVATNGYTDGLVTGLRRSLLPVYSAVIASRPLPALWRERILTEGQSVFEVGPVTTYYRVDAAGRLIFGGRGRMCDADGPDAFVPLQKLAEKIWPGIGEAGWDYGWNGRVALTGDHYPHLHKIGPGGYAALGYNGRGVAMATLMGADMAGIMTEGEADPLFPFTAPRAIAFQPFWPMGVAPALAIARLKARFTR